ncbi:MAG TPA: LysR family transcriptional regulator [Gammaproteobacteria bacterium]
MDRLLQLHTFTRVAERGSFSAAARDLQVTQSAVSKAVTALEQTLGVRLLNRTTRSVSLTEAGRTYYERCRRILADLAEADAAAAGLHVHITGAIKIAAPVPFGLTFISPRVARFHLLHPGLALELELDDRPVDLVQEGVDVAIRLGHLKAPGLVARKLGDSRFVAVASAAYLAAHGTPTRPEELQAHRCLAYSNDSDRWAFKSRSGANRAVNVKGLYRSNNLLVLKDAAMAGAGIARVPRWMVDAEIKAGLLRIVLEEYGLPSFAIHAVFPSARQIPAKVRTFVDFLHSELGSISYFLSGRGEGGR